MAVGDRAQRGPATGPAPRPASARAAREPRRSSGTSAASMRSSAAGASERALKARDLRDYDILHFAAHAIADEAHPERSAVLLVAGRRQRGRSAPGARDRGPRSRGTHRRALGVSDRRRRHPERRRRPEPGARLLRSRRRRPSSAALAHPRRGRRGALRRVLLASSAAARRCRRRSAHAKIEAIAGTGCRPPRGPASCCSATAPIRPFPEGRRQSPRNQSGRWPPPLHWAWRRSERQLPATVARAAGPTRAPGNNPAPEKPDRQYASAATAGGAARCLACAVDVEDWRTSARTRRPASTAAAVSN